ncbi:MAG: glycoside hydrolase family 2 protein [Candidatus Hermodarchaeota archaeon]
MWNKTGWKKISIPASIQQALINEGLLPNPFFGNQSLASIKLEKEHFWLRTELDIPQEWEDDTVILRFYGIDGIAEVYLNGHWLGTSESAFMAIEFELPKSRLNKNGIQQVLIYFRPIKSLLPENIEKMRRSEEEGVRAMVSYGDMFERAFIRKAQVSFDWDFGTRFIPLGLTKPVWCMKILKLSIEEYHIHSKLKDDRASVFCKIKIKTTDFDIKNQISILFDVTDGIYTWSDSKTLEPGFQHKEEILLCAQVTNPKLWWPNGFGNPDRYEARIRLGMRYGITGMILYDEKKFQFGIREVRLLTDKINGRERFTFKINGQRIFCRGANWVPSDLINLIPTSEKYSKIIQMISEANMNMIRIWGGGNIEDKHFYELCDAYGIMVWQDFPFACSLYPDWDQEFLKLVESEASSIIKELWNHPCIVLFCGDNENLWLYQEFNWDSFAKRFYGEKIERLLEDKCKELVPEIPFWISSPASKDPNENENSPYSGDSHNWNVWHNTAPWEAYAEDPSRFISEFGLQAAPEPRTVKEFIPTKELWPPQKSWFFHNLDITKLRVYLKRIGKPKNLEEFCYHSQIAQAEGLKYGIQHFRKNSECNGCLIWQLNDIWPTVSWSLIDFYLRPKISYHVVKRVYRPVQLVLDDDDFLYILNDSNSPIKSTILIFLENTSGKILEQDEIEIDIPANTKRKVGELKPKIKDSLREYLFLKLKNHECEAFVYRTDLKDQKLEQPTIKIELETNELIVTTNKLARYVKLVAKGLKFSEQFFDLSPSTPKRVKFQMKKDLTGIGTISASYWPRTPF